MNYVYLIDSYDVSSEITIPISNFCEHYRDINFGKPS